MQTGERAGFAGSADGQFDLRTFFGEVLNFGVKQNFDAVLLHDREDFGGDVGVFAAQQLRGLLKDGDAAAKSVEKLAKLEANVASTDDEKMLWDGIEFHDGSAVEIGNAFQTIDRRDRRAAAGIDEKFVGSEGALRAVLEAHLNGARPSEPGVAEEKIEIGCLFDAGLVTVAEADDNRALAFANSAQVNGDAAGVDAIIRTTAREVGDAAARDHRFGGSATLVYTRAADVRAFHKSSAEAGIGQCLAKRRARLARADDDGLIVVRCAHK
jgi:hypothetical protein